MADIDVSSLPCMRVFDEQENPEDPDLGVVCGEPVEKVHFARLRPDPWWLGIPLCEEHGREFSGSAILNELEKESEISNAARVAQFMRIYAIPWYPGLRRTPPERLKLQLDLIDEEVGELKRAINVFVIDKRTHGLSVTWEVNAIDAIVDTLYVVYQLALVMGVDIDSMFAIVHEANMSKLGKNGKPIYRDDGKVLKGPNFQPPEPMIRESLRRDDFDFIKELLGDSKK